MASCTDSVDHLSFVLEAMRDGVWKLDANGMVVQCNPALSHALGLASNRLGGFRAKSVLVEIEGHPGASPMRAGDFKASVKTESGQIVPVDVSSRLLRDETGAMTGAVQVLQFASQAEIDVWRERAQRDELTGLVNRSTFDRSLAELGQRSAGLALIDLDGFKAVNDLYGHSAGDEALRAVAAVLRNCFRDTDLVARWGGDEFVALLHGANPVQTRQAVERVREAFPLIVECGATVGASVGWSHSDDGREGLLDRADAAMYREKRRRHAERQGLSVIAQDDRNLKDVSSA